MNKIKNFILNWYYSLNSREKLILAVVMLFLLILFYFVFIRNSYRENEINYNELNSQEIIDNSNVVYNRERILSLDEIIVKIFKINQSRLNINDKIVSIKELYNNSVTNNYKKEISYKKFKQKIELIQQDVYGDLNNIEVDYFNTIIDKVYYSDKYDMFLVKLKTINEKDRYIGLRIINEYNYNIVYID